MVRECVHLGSTLTFDQNNTKYQFMFHFIKQSRKCYVYANHTCQMHHKIRSANTIISEKLYPNSLLKQKNENYSVKLHLC